MSYDPTLYLGSAVHYRPGRPAYSPQLESTLVDLVGLDGVGRLLDVGCGPGILTARLATFFEEAIGLDPDPDMLTEGRDAADGIDNIRWIRALADDLPAAAPGPYRLVTFGQSFHRLDERRVAEIIYDMLEPGGAMALITHDITARPVPTGPGAPPIPHDELQALVRKYLGSTRRAGQGVAAVRSHRFEDILVLTRFGMPRVVFAPGRPDLIRDTDSVISGYLSMSWSAPHLYGPELDNFIDDARHLLAERSSDGRFWDWPGDTSIVLATKSE